MKVSKLWCLASFVGAALESEKAQDHDYSSVGPFISLCNVTNSGGTRAAMLSRDFQA